ncbi:VOC family protein [Parvibaculum sp.]|uniref:VOC family protein n=1 Tax=Parvibaculum sp. TaxID=2024848 RepID=UPI0032108EBE
MSVASLGYIGFEVSDLQAWDAYMTGFLGLMPGRGEGPSAKYRMDERSFRIQVDEGQKDDLSFIGFEVATPEDLKALRDRLTAAGIDCSVASNQLAAERGVRDLAVLKDPSGLQVEIYVGATALTHVPFNSPAGVSGFRTGAQGVGHVVMAVDKIDEVRAFYTGLLGFRLSDTIGIAISPDFTLTLEFYHCNPRHHTLALVPMPAPRRMHHFMVEMATMDDVGYAMDRMAKYGVRQTMTLGKHTNDQMVSFYAATPSGFEVEVGTAGIAVQDDSWRVTHHEATSMWGHKHCN